MLIVDNNIHSQAKKSLRKLSMALLALLPLLAWYEIPFPVGLGSAFILFLSAYTIALNKLKINILPATFWIVFAYVCVMWIYHHNFEIWSVFPPGGWIFFIFVLTLIWGIQTFDLNLLKKYMKYVVFISAPLFWLQFILKLIYGHNWICFVPNLTGKFIYEDLSYAELVHKQLTSVSGRPCSIFLEPSYMAYYYVTYLAILWFSHKFKNRWINKEVVFIIVSLLALQSGSGMVGLIVLFFAKIHKIFSNASIKKRLRVVFIVIPLIASGVYLYVNSEFGQKLISRSKELSTEGSSGFSRVVGGIIMFEQLSTTEQIIGIGNPRDRFETVKADGSTRFYVNGLQTILLSLGYIGALLYSIFYTSLFRKVNLTSKVCIIVLFIMSLLESNYLNPYMMLLTIIPCAEYHFNKLRNKTK